MLDKVWFPLSLTLWVATISSVLVLCTGIIIAYVFARRDFWGKELAELLVTLPLVLPPTVIGYLLVIFVGRKGLLGHFIYNFFLALGSCLPGRQQSLRLIQFPFLLW